MLQMFTNYSPTAAKVTEQLLSRFGADKLSLVERLSPNIYRGFTTSGTLILATVADNGELVVREEEMLA